MKDNTKDVLHSLTKGAVSSIPIAGGVLGETFSLLVKSPVEKRRDEFLEDLFKRIKKLENKNNEFKIENLQKNDIFISALIHAIQIAVKNHQKEKIEMLRNAVINSATIQNPNSEKLFFLNLIDEITPLHIIAMKFFVKKGLNTRKWGESFSVLKKYKIGELATVMIEKDLLNKNLIKKIKGKIGGDYDTTSFDDENASEYNSYHISLTDFGESFLNFIKSR